MVPGLTIVTAVSSGIGCPHRSRQVGTVSTRPKRATSFLSETRVDRSFQYGSVHRLRGQIDKPDCFGIMSTCPRRLSAWKF